MNASITPRNACRRSLLATLATAAFASVAHGAPSGELDATFGENGRVMLGARFDITFGNAALQQPADGKILVAGSTWDGVSHGFDFAVFRLNPDGSPDAGFGNNGLARIDFDELTDVATDLAIQADGKIVIAGHAEIGAGNFDLALTRLNPDGSIDPTFGDDGRAVLGQGDADEFTARMLLLPNGRIVIAGSTLVGGDYDALFARFNADGAPDASFGSGPMAGATVVDSGVGQDQSYWMARQADGKLVACGQSRPYAFTTEGSRVLAIRLNADGGIDTGFGSNGIALISSGTAHVGTRSCIAMPDGTTVLAGFAESPGNTDLMIARLASNGVLDTSFASAGFSRIDLGSSESAHAIIRLADGNLAVAGLAAALGVEPAFDPAVLWDHDYPADVSDVLFARIDADSGALDPDFGSGGVTRVDFGEGSSPSQAIGRGLIQQLDGKLLAVGARVEPGDWYDTQRVALTRVDPAGAGNTGVASLTETFLHFPENNAHATLTVRRTGGITGILSIDYVAVPETAGAPSDFTATAGTLTWMSGDSDPKTILIPLTNDGARESFEWFEVELSGPANHVGLDTVMVTIDDDDARTAPPSGGGSASRGGGGAPGIESLLLLAALGLISAGQRRGRSACSTDRC